MVSDDFGEFLLLFYADGLQDTEAENRIHTKIISS